MHSLMQKFYDTGAFRSIHKATELYEERFKMKMKETNKYPSLHIGDVVAKLPVIQGGMGVGVSLGNLAGAVAKAGGVGILSTAHIGYKEPDFETNSHEANMRAIESEYKKARAIAPDGVIGFNIMVAMNHYKECVQTVAKSGADLIISGAGLPMTLPEYVENFKTKIAPIVSSAKAAQVILKRWEKKYNRTADMVVIEGPKAGGHLGFSREEALSITDEAYEKTIKDVISVVRSYADKFGHEIPVVVAGGIYDNKDVKRIMALGADGVQVASRFVATEECDADIRYKQAYVDCKKEDIHLVASPVGMPGRAIRNAFTERVAKEGKEKITKCYACLRTCKPGETPYCISKALINAVKGDVDNGLIFCGAESYRIDKIETVEDVMEALLG